MSHMKEGRQGPVIDMDAHGNPQFGAQEAKEDPRPAPEAPIFGGGRMFVPVAPSTIGFYAKLQAALEPIKDKLPSFKEVTFSHQSGSKGEITLFRVALVPQEKGALLELTYHELDAERIARDIARIAG